LGGKKSGEEKKNRKGDIRNHKKLVEGLAIIFSKGEEKKNYGQDRIMEGEGRIRNHVLENTYFLCGGRKKGRNERGHQGSQSASEKKREESVIVQYLKGER